MLAGLLANQGFAALAQVILARRIGALDYGRYLACVGLATMLVAFINFGFDQWLLVNTSTTSAGLARSFYSALRVRAPLTAAWLLGLVVLQTVLPGVTFSGGYLALAGISVAGDCTALLAYTALRNRGIHGPVTLLQSAGAAAVLLAVFLLPLAPGRAGLFLVIRATTSAVMAVLAIYTVRRTLGRSPGQLSPASDVLRRARPFMISELAVSVYMRADLSILSLMAGVVAASIYGPATSLLSMCFLAPNALYLLVLPSLARLHAVQPSRYKRLARRQLLLQAAVGITLLTLVLAFAPLLVRSVLGAGYAASASTLRVLSPILLLKSISFGLGGILTSQARQRSRTQVQIVVAVFNLLANLVVVQSYGITGVAIVYVISEAVLALGYAAVLMRSRWADALRTDRTLEA